MPADAAQSNRHLYPMLRTGYKCLDVIRSNRIVIRYLALSLVITFLPAAYASENSSLEFIEIGMSESQIVSAYGPPISITKYPKDDMFGMNETKLLVYEGLKLDMHLGSKGFYVWRLRISGDPWAYRNNKLTLGITIDKLKAILGEPISTKTEGEIEFYYYNPYTFDGWATITIENGTVIKILATEDWT